MRGMEEGSGTRSSLLFEVGRLLDECDELPQVLLMENVVQVHNRHNIDDFNKWLNRLSWMGYKNYWQDLNARNYGTPQNRDRCFCVSILNERGYEFPKPVPLEHYAQDYLEEEVDERYRVGGERINILIENAKNNGILLTKECARQSIDRPTDRPTDR